MAVFNSNGLLKNYPVFGPTTWTNGVLTADNGQFGLHFLIFISRYYGYFSLQKYPINYTAIFSNNSYFLIQVWLQSSKN